METRILGLDYGEKTIGVAVSDGLNLTAQALEVIRRPDENSLKNSLRRLEDIIREYDVKTIVLSYPKNMDGSEGKRCLQTLVFKERLQRNFKRLAIVLWDERLSTVAAAKNISGLSKEKRSQIIDKMAAQFILQGYLDKMQKKRGAVGMDESYPTIIMTDEFGDEQTLMVIADLNFEGQQYLLVSEADMPEDEDELEATILKEITVDGDEATYVLVEDEAEFGKIAALFQEDNDDYEIE